jgi:hypothetical protein
MKCHVPAKNNLTSAIQEEVVRKMYRLKKLHAKLKICGVEIIEFME